MSIKAKTVTVFVTLKILSVSTLTVFTVFLNISPAISALFQEKATSSDSAPSARASEKTSSELSQDLNKPYKDEAVQHYNKGVELHQGGFFNQAIGEYKSALAADQRMEEAYSNLGLIYVQQRNYTKALDAFQKALTLKPARPTTLNGLGTAYYAKGRLEEAMKHWRRALEIDPRFASAHFNMGNALENEKDIEGALKCYVQALRINPSMADAYYRIGSIFTRQKHAAQACTFLAKAMELAPEAEFIQDARKQLNNLKSQFTREEDSEPEMRVRIMTPPKNDKHDQALPVPSSLSLPSDSGKSSLSPDKTLEIQDHDKW